MAAGGLYTIGGSFWEFGEPDWERTRYFMLFGCAEDHDSNPIKIELGKLKAKGVKFVSVNPVRTGYSAIADEWLGITPGTDGLLVLALVHELLRAGKVDLDFLRALHQRALAGDRRPGRRRPRPVRAGRRRPAAGLGPRARRRCVPGGRCRRAGRRSRARSSCPTAAARARSSSCWPSAISIRPTRPMRSRPRTGIAAATIRRIAAELAQAAFAAPIVLDQPWTDAWGRRHAQMVGRPVGMHAMRGISAHSNGFHTCRALHLLQMLLGTIDAPGGFRYKPPYPKPVPPRAEAGRQARRGRSRTSRCRARRSASRAGRRTCWSRPTAARCASTRRSPGRRRSPRTA